MRRGGRRRRGPGLFDDDDDDDYELPPEPEDDGVAVPSMRTALDRVRRETPTDPGPAVAIRIYKDEGIARAGFEHVACEVRMDWVAHGGCWFCPECSFELSPAEARIVVNRERSVQLGLLQMLDHLDTDAWQRVDGRKQAGWRQWLKAMWARLRSFSTSKRISAKSV